ncbi:MAG: hypothetical protein ACREV3_02320 [Gammaproteobacteria bacterium]
MRRSWGTDLAADAALGDVTLAGALGCDNALPAADVDFEPVEVDRKVDDAARATGERVVLGLAIEASWLTVNRNIFIVYLYECVNTT